MRMEIPVITSTDKFYTIFVDCFQSIKECTSECFAYLDRKVYALAIDTASLTDSSFSIRFHVKLNAANVSLEGLVAHIAFVLRTYNKEESLKLSWKIEVSEAVKAETLLYHLYVKRESNLVP